VSVRNGNRRRSSLAPIPRSIVTPHRATAIVLHPSDWSAIRRSKAVGSGQYLASDPVGGTNKSLWDVPVAVTSDITPGVAIVGNFQAGGTGVRAQIIAS
jgi:HK97 family phage major capsid protein